MTAGLPGIKMSVFCRFVRQTFMLATFIVSTSCFANLDSHQGDGPRWACWYSPANLTVQCLLSKSPSAGLEVRAAEVAHSIDRRLPALVRTIWGSPEQLAGARIDIPLMTIPFEMDFVRLLAKSVMCGSRPDCSLHFDGNSDGLAPVRAATLESGASEPEVMAEILAQGITLAQSETTVRQSGKRKRVALLESDDAAPKGVVMVAGLK